MQATSALGDHTMMIMDTPLPDSDGKLSAPLMIWATGRDPLTIYTRFILSSYIWRVYACALRFALLSRES